MSMASNLVLAMSLPKLCRSLGEARSLKRARVRCGVKGRDSGAKPSGVRLVSRRFCSWLRLSTSPLIPTQATLTRFRLGNPPSSLTLRRKGFRPQADASMAPVTVAVVWGNITQKLECQVNAIRIDPFYTRLVASLELRLKPGECLL